MSLGTISEKPPNQIERKLQKWFDFGPKNRLTYLNHNMNFLQNLNNYLFQKIWGMYFGKSSKMLILGT